MINTRISSFAPIWASAVTLLLLGGCSPVERPAKSGHYGKNVEISPSNPLRKGATENICEIFRDNPKWYLHANQSYRRWGTPIAVQLAFVYQESRFVATASPKTSVTIFSNKKSSALGYAQALDGTWRDYVNSTGNFDGDRTSMRDALDFIGWYNSNATKKLGLEMNQPRELYLAYHEGIKGYSLGTFEQKKWLKTVAGQVHERAVKYDQQLRGCLSDVMALAQN